MTGRSRRLWAAGAVALVALSGCGEPAQPQAIAAQAEPPTMAEVRCDEQGATAVTGRVQPQRDGIHIRIENTSDAREFYIRSATDGAQNHGGFLEEPIEDITTTMPPGDLLIGCFRGPRDVPYSAPDERFATITVVDPQNLWTSPELDCGVVEEGIEFTGWRADRVEPRDVAELIRAEVPGVLPDDVIVRPGYPETQWKVELRQIQRDGKAVASAMVHQEASGWKAAVRRCNGSSIGTMTAAIKSGWGPKSDPSPSPTAP